MKLNKQDLINSLNMNARELQQAIDQHCCLVTAILKGNIDEHNLLPIIDQCPKRSREARLEEAIKEAIDELEESRKAFKSKRLEMLRKKLTRILIESD